MQNYYYFFIFIGIVGVIYTFGYVIGVGEGKRKVVEEIARRERQEAEREQMLKMFSQMGGN